MKRELGQREALLKTLLVFFALFFFVFVLWAQKDQPPAKAPAPDKTAADDAGRVNPVKPTQESLAKAKKMYAIDCAMCHGDKGDGKGDMASDIKNVTDFTNPDALKNHTDGQLFHTIRHGKGDMPPEGDRAKDDDIWNLVNYVRAFAKK
ncbi:MAG: cytochrome c [Acidobacteriia bacterium]|nr:cytochrome c [Terriglobia bacterium]